MIRRLLSILSPLFLMACGGGGTEPGKSDSLTVEVEPPSGLIVGVGQRLQFTAKVFQGGGNLLLGEAITWSTSDPSVATVDNSGTATGVSAGLVTVTAQAGVGVGTADLEVYVAPTVESYVSGQLYSGREGYTEYFAGNLPIIIGAPHGGDMEPEEIPDRTDGVTAADRNTRELSLALAAAIHERTGQFPHVIINRLHRKKLDANRDLGEAAQDNPFAEQAWQEFHAFIEDAREAVISANGQGLYLDMHGHSHDIQRLEVGYLLTRSELNLPDSALDALAGETSVWALAQSVDIPFSELIRGPNGFGTLLANRGYRSVPSESDPFPGEDPYFTGGYDLKRHGSRGGGAISAIQIEHYFEGVRDTGTNRASFASALAWVVGQYLAEHFDIDWQAGG